MQPSLWTVVHCCRSTAAGQLSLVRPLSTHCVAMAAMMENYECLLVASQLKNPCPPANPRRRFAPVSMPC